MADRVSSRHDADSVSGRPHARRFPRRTARALLAAAAVLAVSACAVGPDYQRPVQDVGVAYAHAPEGRWIPADTPPQALPADWWALFGDPVLNDLMDRMPRGNLDLAQAEAQFREARAALDSARAGLFPSLGVSGSVNRAGQGVSGAGNPATTYSLSATASWEVDLWGRVRRDVEAARAGEQASAADLDAMRLSLRSTLAQAYFGVRASQLQDALLARTLDEYARALEMTRNRLAAGVASPADVAAASAQLDQARAQRIRLGWQREQQIHAIAVLLGQVPASFRLGGGASLPAVPRVPVGVPSALLLRRPDVAGAERRVAQANARIGVAQAAWFPDLTLSAQGGYRAAEFASWIMAPARFWTLGPALAASVFDGGARAAAVASARAAYDAQAAAYRKTVLDALREVEDALVQTQALAEEQAARDRALAAARETLRQVTNQYRAGLVDYLSVVQAQTSALSAEQTALDVRAERLTASTQLIAALGGGYSFN
ncbi:efflux transporter outer membrane subunit [Castellaniella sp.]|jgi:NodT family efflux transporter outer membrane factor (OMF) lipoprotein|uniref:efflux transporter outer membrane subunit n=1 Tax=Castellaniella sp. TaxID=1955812 RepID=UPI002D806025|nr:efflux transporter outer membrane subunit [Castellaniella sp.]HET8703159.1 efflux transporter outer membrane subunit [Castellaniella sp.]